jgi:hypothetical protein
MSTGGSQRAMSGVARSHVGGKLITRVNVQRWIGTGLVVGLLALLASVGVQAEAVQPLAAPAYGIWADHCETAYSPEEDPFASPDHVDVLCAPQAASAVESVDVAGNVALVRSLVDGESTARFYVKRDGVWERFPYSSTPDWEYLYTLEQENLSMAVANARPMPEAAAANVSADPRGVRYWEQFFGPSSTIAERSTATTSVSADPRGVRYWEQFFELPGAVAERSTATTNVSADPRGVRYWEQFFGLSSTIAGRTTASLSSNDAELNDLIEHEIDGASGSALNTRDDLVSALFQRSWATNAAGEDLAREAK